MSSVCLIQRYLLNTTPDNLKSVYKFTGCIYTLSLYVNQMVIDPELHPASCQTTAGPPAVRPQGRTRARRRCGASPPLPPLTSGPTRQLRLSPFR